METNGLGSALGIADQASALRQRLASLSADGTQSEGSEAREAATEFEAYLIKVLLGEMRKTLSGDALGGGQSNDGYQSLMDDALARYAARAGGIGLADQLIGQWESRG